jgi:P-type Cu2+ transporter
VNPFEGDLRVPAGSILLSRESVSVTADEAWGDSLIGKLTAATDLDRGSPLFQRLLRIYLAVILALGALVFIAWTALGDWRGGLQAMISVFVVSCPCALGVAVPLADEWAASRLARAGAFARRASLWPRLRRVKHVIFDKTGTLTLERPVLENPQDVDTLDTSAALALARLTRASLHPASRTLLEALGMRGQHLLATIGPIPVEEIPGTGVRCVAEDGEWFLGKGGGGTELRHEGHVVACFIFADCLRPGALETVRQLQNRGLSLHILSGDAPEKVTCLARQLGLPAGSFTGGLSPTEKAAAVSALDHQNTLYVGDGANDSLALDAALVTATPVVDRSLLESKADFYALGSGLAYLAEALNAADARAIGVRRAFIFALAYNLVVVALAATAHMGPLLAAVLMPLSSIFSILLAASAPHRSPIDLTRENRYGHLAVPSDARSDDKAGEQAVRSHPA